MQGERLVCMRRRSLSDDGGGKNGTANEGLANVRNPVSRAGTRAHAWRAVKPIARLTM